MELHISGNTTLIGATLVPTKANQYTFAVVIMSYSEEDAILAYQYTLSKNIILPSI